MAARADIRQGEFFPIHLAIMQPGTLAPVGLYLKAGTTEEFTLYKAAQTPLTQETRQRLLDRGAGVLYLRKRDERGYNEYVEQNLVAIIRDGLLPPREVCRTVYRSSSCVMQDVLADPRSGKNLQRVSTIARAVVLSIIKRPAALWDMTALASHDYATYRHSVHVAVFLVGASRELLAIKEQAILERIGEGGMLHDIGKSQIPLEILSKPGRLTPAEFEKVKEHPALGVELVERQRKVPATITAIIRSHHERIDGHGYPDGLTGDRIRPPARLAKIIDAYDAMTTNRPYAPARTSYETLRVMKKMAGNFDVALLDAFVRFLGPKELRAQEERR